MIRIVHLFIIISFNLRASISLDYNETFSSEVKEAIKSLKKSQKKLLENREKRIKELRSIKNRTLIEEQELNALYLVKEGNLDKMNNYLKGIENHKKLNIQYKTLN